MKQNTNSGSILKVYTFYEIKIVKDLKVLIGSFIYLFLCNVFGLNRVTDFEFQRDIFTVGTICTALSGLYNTVKKCRDTQVRTYYNT